MKPENNCVTNEDVMALRVRTAEGYFPGIYYLVGGRWWKPLPKEFEDNMATATAVIEEAE